MQELWLTLDPGVAASFMSGKAINIKEATEYQCQYERGISNLEKNPFLPNWFCFMGKRKNSVS